MKVAAIQHDIVWEDAERTRKNVAPLIAQAAAAGARLIVLTEMFATGFSMQPERIAEYAGGANEQFLVDNGQQDTVMEVRTRYQHAIRSSFSAAVERATGRTVVGFASTTSLEEPRFMAEVFRLE